jgi:hypothetical protein
MSTVFNHEKESLVEALGFDQSDLKNINIKLAKSSKYIFMETPKQSKLCEHIAKEFSYNELLFVATLFVTEKTAEILEQSPFLVASLQMKDMLQKLRDGEEL